MPQRILVQHCEWVLQCTPECWRWPISRVLALSDRARQDCIWRWGSLWRGGRADLGSI